MPAGRAKLEAADGLHKSDEGRVLKRVQGDGGEPHHVDVPLAPLTHLLTEGWVRPESAEEPGHKGIGVLYVPAPLHHVVGAHDDA